MSRNVIETQGLSKVYKRDIIGREHGKLKISLFSRKVHALKNLDLQVTEGEIFGLLGPNGAGKTTTIKILMTIHKATSGTAKLMGKPLGDKDVKAQVGFLPENPYFYDYLNGYEFLDYYARLYGMKRRGLKKHIDGLLERVGLGHAGNRPLRGYSKGMLQRIGIAQALLNDPKLILLDEPQSGLDPLGRKEVRDLILQLRDEGKTVCFSSHIMADAEMICDRVGILNKGELVALGELGSLLSGTIREVEVVAKGVPAIIRDRAGQDAAVRDARDGTLFTFNSEERASAFVTDALAGGAHLISYTPRRQTLEEYFIGKVQEKPGALPSPSGSAPTSGSSSADPAVAAAIAASKAAKPAPVQSGGTAPFVYQKPVAEDVAESTTRMDMDTDSDIDRHDS